MRPSKSMTISTVLVANDRAYLNRYYRTELLALLESAGLCVHEIGLFEHGRLSLSSLWRLLFGNEDLIISSNLRSNTVALASIWKPGMVILNGLGRYRNSKFARWFIALLLRKNSRKAIIVQSRADYQYFRRYAPKARLFWIPGSGGSEKKIGTRERPVSVQRADKIANVADSLRQYYSATGSERSLVLVGCPDSSEMREHFPDFNLEITGRVDASNLFVEGRIFLQPTGYGEGVPHTLVDAIVSRMSVRIANIEFVRYGLSHLGIRAEPVGEGWSKLIVPEHARRALSVETISRDYFRVLATEFGLEN